MKALYLGWITDSSKSVTGLLEAGIEPVVINTQKYFEYSHVPGIAEKVSVACDLYENVWLPFNRLSRFGFTFSPVFRWFGKTISQGLAETFEKHTPIDFVFAHWGVGVLPEVILLKKHRKTKNLPVILNMETFPTGWQAGWREKLEIKVFQRVAPLLAGLIVPCEEMAEVLCRIAPKLSKTQFFIKPFYYPKQFLRTPENPRPVDDPQAVFMGQWDQQRRLNDVSQQMLALANSGLKIHCAHVEDLQHPNIRFFPYMHAEAFPSGELFDFVRQFKVCLVTYNLPESLQAPLRYRVSLPSRFLMPLAAGVPVLLPRNHFLAMEKIITSENIGYAYESPEDAAEAIRSQSWCNKIENARFKRSRFVFDGKAFRSFVDMIV